jgi:diadenosine tetraphosphate (Ap4A) HIT family hydrolase
MGCRSCELVARRDRGEAPLWDAIVRTAHWDVVHCWPTSHEGWLVLAVRVHRDSIADLTADEAAELGPLLRVASQALHERVGAVKTYVAQFAEHPDHQHVHVHLVPVAADHPDQRRGPQVFGLLGDESTAVSEDRMNELALALRADLAARLPST